MYFRVVLDGDEEVTLLQSVVDEEGVGDDEEEDGETTRITQLMLKRYKSLIKSPVPTHSEVSKFMTSIERKTKKEVTHIDSLQKSELCSTPYTGKYFVFLMSLPHSIASKTDSYVGYTPNPIAEVYRHNHKLTVDRNTCMAAPHWRLDIALGPFICKEVAIECGRAWVNGTRGKESKRAKAAFLASAYNVNMYTYTEKSERQIEDLLEEHCDPLFIVLLKEGELQQQQEDTSVKKTV